MIGTGIFGSAYLADAVNVRAEANKRVFDDQVFSLSKRFTVVSSGVVDIVFDPLAHTGLITFLPVAFISGVGGPILIDLYLGTDAEDDGTSLSCINRNNASAVVCDMVVRLNPTVNTPGTLGPEFLLPSDGQGATSKAGGEVREDLVFNVNTAIKYMFRLTNTDTVNDTIMSVSASWFELPPFP